MKRRGFLAAAAAGAAAAASLSTAAIAADTALRAGRKALVLVGGVNRGAYQAGALVALADKAGLKDGEPLDYDIVCGTSIGALNSFFVATAQYSKLKELWVDTIATQNVFRLKHPYEKVPNTDSGVITRLAAALSLGNGMTTNVMGVLDPAPVRSMLEQHFDPAATVHIPSYIATTNLTRQTSEIFIRRATTPAGLQRQSINDTLLADFPLKGRTASNEVLHQVLFATACLPLAFDPVEIEREDGSGSADQYCDGGITANAPINLAQLCAHTIDVLLVDPKKTPPDVRYKNAVEVAMGVFQTMQDRILLYQVIAAYAASNAALPFDPYTMRPETQLPGKLGDFNDGPSLVASYDIGYADGRRGWNKFVFPEKGLLAPFDRV